MIRRLALGGPFVALLLALSGCAGTGGTAAPRPAADAPGRTERQVMVTLAESPAVAGAELIAELELRFHLRSVLSWPLAALRERCIVFDVLPNRSPIDVAQIADRIAHDPRVRSAQPILIFHTTAAPAPPASNGGDPYSHLQHAATALRLPQAHRVATGKGVRIAVVDTGVDLDHPDLRGRIAAAGNFVDRGEQTFTSDIHGTAVAGVMAAAAGNAVGIAGVAPDAQLLALKACWPEVPGARQALCNSYTLAKAVDFALTSHVQVLNFSLAGPPDPLLGRLLRVALDRGVAVVAAVAAGDPGGGFPASLDGVLAVQGTGPGGSQASPVSPGRRVPLAAPGVDILSTVPRASYDFFTGSSLAAAEVSGIAALLLERRPHLTPAQLAALILETARPGGADAPRTVDACAALAAVTEGLDCS
jgi:subtilisin family serine protease